MTQLVFSLGYAREIILNDENLNKLPVRDLFRDKLILFAVILLKSSPTLKSLGLFKQGKTTVGLKYISFLVITTLPPFQNSKTMKHSHSISKSELIQSNFSSDINFKNNS